MSIPISLSLLASINHMSSEQKISGKKVSTSHSRGYISKKRHLLRKGIEEEMGQHWNEVEEALSARLQTLAERRHWLIRSSPQMLAVAEMILAQEKSMTIVRFLRTKDPERFADHITDAALLGQVLRFKEEVISTLEAEEGDDVSTNRLDFYARLSGKEHVDVQGMMTKLVLYQESRLCTSLEKQNVCTYDWMRNTKDRKAERQMQKAWKEGSKELDRYWKFLMSLAAYELMNQPCSAEQREYMHEVMKYSRGSFPR